MCLYACVCMCKCFVSVCPSVSVCVSVCLCSCGRVWLNEEYRGILAIHPIHLLFSRKIQAVTSTSCQVRSSLLICFPRFKATVTTVMMIKMTEMIINSVFMIIVREVKNFDGDAKMIPRCWRWYRLRQFKLSFHTLDYVLYMMSMRRSVRLHGTKNDHFLKLPQPPSTLLNSPQPPS